MSGFRTALFVLGAVLSLSPVHRACAQADGSARWAFSTGASGFVESSPTVGPDGTIYVGVKITTTPHSGLVLAINRNGSEKWRFRTPDWIDSSPTLGADGTLYAGCWDGKLYALNSATGAKKWERALGPFIYSSPAISRDGTTIYSGSGDFALHAVSASTGAELWSFPTGYWVDSSPAVGDNGTIYFGSWDKSVYAVNPDGTEKWRVPTSGAVISSPAIGRDGMIYVATYNAGAVYAIMPDDGVVKWVYSAAGSLASSPALGADGAIYLGGIDQQFYALNPDGTERWKYRAGGSIFSSAAVRADGTIIFGADDGLVRALNPAGTLKWSYTTGDLVASSPAVAADGSIYVGSFDGKLHSLNGTVLPPSAFSSWPMFRRDSVHSGLAAVPAKPARLVNLSTRAAAGSASNLIAGLVIQGDAPKNFLIRAAGPALAQFEVPTPLSDPKLTLRTSPSNLITKSNDNWGSEGNAAQLAAAATALGAFALPAGSKDAAVLIALGPGAYTTVVENVDGTPGIALVEAYDAASAPNSTTRLVNLSARGRAGTGSSVLIPGFVIAGDGPLRVLVRAVGPGLIPFGVTGTLPRPVMTLFSGSSPIRTNTGWTADGYKGDLAAAAQAVGAFALADSSADCAALLTLAPGGYTVQVSDLGGVVGEALVEIYVVP